MKQAIKQRFVYYKKYKVDIWGVFKNTLQVISDNTIYKNGSIVFKIFKLKKFLFYNKKKYIQAFDKFMENKNLYKAKLVKFFIFYKSKKIFKEVFTLHYIYILKFLILLNLWKNVYKFTISERMQKIMNLFFVKKKYKVKIFFKKPFIYEPRVPFLVVKKFKIKNQIIGIQIIKLFYIVYSLKQISKIGKKAKRKKGVFEQNFLSIIEAKLPSFIYRTSLFSTLFESIKFVKQNNVWINKEFNSFIFYTVKLFDLVGFRIIYKAYIFWNFFKRLRRKAFIFFLPSCFFVSFAFFFIILIRNIQVKDIINSFNFDYYVILSFKK